MEPPNKKMLIHGVDIALMIITISSMVLRLCSRLVKHGGGLWWDDWLAFAGGIFAIAEGTVLLLLVSYGYGVPVRFQTDKRNLSKSMQDFYAGQALFGICITFVKYSAIMFYARLFRSNRNFQRCLWIAGTILLSWVAIAFLYILQCQPIDKFWNSEKPGRCISTERLYDSGAALDLLLDIMLLLLPMPMVWGLQMNQNRKILVSGVFACGYCALLTSIGRLVATVRDSKSISEDPDWNSITMILWTVSETYVSVISINLPSCFQLLKRNSRKGVWSFFNNGTFDDQVSGSFDSKLSAYNSGGYRFSPVPVDSEFSRKMSLRKSHRISYSNRVSVYDKDTSDLEAIEDKCLSPLTPVHIRKDITVSTTRLGEGEEF